VAPRPQDGATSAGPSISSRPAIEAEPVPDRTHLDNRAISCVKSPALLMKKIPDNAGGTVLPGSDYKFPENQRGGIEARVFRTMAVAVALAVIGSLPFAQWRVTTGLLLGGLLSLLNHHWLSSSTTAAFSVIAHGTKPQLKLTKYILRYLVIATAVFLAYKLNIVSLAATIAGLCSFVVALFVEAFREFYFAITHREETS
jgi:hypothetical protein